MVVEEHSFRTDRSDEFTIALDGTTLDTVPAELSFVFVIRGLVLTVRDGCIVSLDSGRCEITALVQVSGVDLDAVTGTSDLRLTLAVTPPIRIRPWPQTPRPADEPREVVMPDTVKDRQRQRRASPAGSPPSKDLA